MNKFNFALFAILMVGCGSRTDVVTDSFVLPPELKGCTIHKLYGESSKTLYVVNCPLTVTTINSQKHPTNVTVVKRVKIDTTTVYDTIKE